MLHIKNKSLLGAGAHRQLLEVAAGACKFFNLTANGKPIHK